MLSLHSARSRGSSSPRPANKRYNAPDDSSTASHTRIVAEIRRENIPLGQVHATDQHEYEVV